MLTEVIVIGIIAIVAIVALHWFRRGLKKKPGRLCLAQELSFVALLVAYGSLGFSLLFGATSWLMRGTIQQDDPGASSPASFEGATHLAFARGEISEDALMSAELVRFPDSDSISYTHDYSDWDYDFNGFDRAVLSADHARLLRNAIIASRPAPKPLYTSKLTHQEIASRGERGRMEYKKVLGPAASPRDQKHTYISIDAEGVSTSLYMPPGRVKAGVLVFRLTLGRNVYVRVLLGQNGFFVYIPGPTGSLMNALYGQARAGRDVLEAAFANSAPREIEVLYPELSADKAVDRSASIFGDIYRQTVRYVETTPEIITAVGPIREVRPAKGGNTAAYWMDFTATFYFRVRGERGDALVRADLFDDDRKLEMFSNGKFTKIP